MTNDKIVTVTPDDYEQYRPALNAFEYVMGLRLDADFPMAENRKTVIRAGLAFAAAIPRPEKD